MSENAERPSWLTDTLLIVIVVGVIVAISVVIVMCFLCKKKLTKEEQKRNFTKKDSTRTIRSYHEANNTSVAESILNNTQI